MAVRKEEGRHLIGGVRPSAKVESRQRQILELEAPLRVGADETIGSQFACLCANLRASNRRSVVRGHDAATDHRGACGLIAAAFGKRRVRTAAQVTEARGDLRVLADTAASLLSRAPIEQVLEDIRRFFALGGVVLRRADERLVAAAPSGHASLSPPPTELDASTLVGSDVLVHRLGRAGFRLPDRGGRLRLPGDAPLFLDLWEGSPEGLTLDQRRALTVVAMMIALAQPAARS